MMIVNQCKAAEVTDKLNLFVKPRHLVMLAASGRGLLYY